MESKKPSDLAERVVIRTPEGMRDQLNDLARQNGRSANAEAVKALEAWVARHSEAEQTFASLPKRLSDRIDAAAKLNGRSLLDEITARLAESFAPVDTRHVEGEQLDLRAEIRDAMHEAIEGLLGDPERLKSFQARSRVPHGDKPDTD